MHVQMINTSFTWMILAVPILLFGVLLAVVIALLAIPATRKAGWIVLTAFLGLGAVLFLLVGFFWIRTGEPMRLPSHPVALDDRAVMHDPIIKQRSWQGHPDSNSEFQRVVVNPIKQQGDGQFAEAADSKMTSSTPTAANLPVEAPPAPPEAKQPIDKALTAESARLIDALSRVLAKTILEDRTAWEDLAAKATKQMARPVEKEAPKAETTVDVKPATAPEIVPTPSPKPAWVDKTLRREGADFFVDAVGDPYATPVECEAALPECVQRKAVTPYVEIFLPEAIGKVKIPSHVLETFVTDRWVETRSTSQGEMQILHALVKLDGGSQDLIKEFYRQTIVSRRLLPLGVYFSLGFLSLAAVWGYLKADLATGGKHRGILRTAAAIVILSVVAVFIAVTA